MEYDSQEVVDNAYRHSYQILEKILKKYKEDEDLILMIKNLVYYLEDYAYWKNDTKEGKEGLPPTSGVEEGH